MEKPPMKFKFLIVGEQRFLKVIVMAIKTMELIGMGKAITMADQ
jgi:hypothetical protein